MPNKRNVMSPAKQAYYHAICAVRHGSIAFAALWHYWAFRGLVFAGVLLVVSLLGGCRGNPVVVAPTDTTALSPVGNAADEAKAAAAAAATAQAERDSRLAASTEVVGRQNEAAPESPQKPVIAAEVGLMQRTLAVSPSDADRAAALERESLMLTGKLSEAAKHYADASAKADILNSQIAKANEQRDAALARLDAAIVAAEKQLAAQQAKHLADMAKLKAANDKALEEARSEVMRDQVAWLNRSGAACEAAAILVIGIGFFFGGLATLRKLGPIALFLGFCGLCCFGLAQIVGAAWFKWAILSIVSIVAVWVAVWLYRHYRQGDLKAEVDARAAKVNAVLGDVVGGVDAVRKKLKEAGSITKAEADKLLSEWVTEHDGVAAEVDAIRREKGLI